MNNDLIKQKNAHMDSILKNPKLSRILNDAIKAPIGSTKREQAKSVLSIMKKLSGIKNDGMGGPDMPGMSQNTPSTPNYNNLMIFPAAPKFKTKNNPISQPSQANDGKGGPGDATSTPASWIKGIDWNPTPTPPSSDFITGTGNQTSDNNYSNLSSDIFNSPFGQTNTIKPSWLSGINWNPTTPSSSPYITSSGNTPENSGTSNIFSAISGLNNLNQSNDKSVLNTSDVWKVGTPTTETSSDTSGTQTGTVPFSKGAAEDADMYGGGAANLPPGYISNSEGYTVNNIKQIQDALVKAGYMSQADVNTGYGVYGPKTKAAILAAQSGAAPTGSAPVGNTGNTGGGSASNAVAAAVKSGVGATGFAMDYANSKFGGGLDQYVANLDAKLKKDFNLEPLEQQLSDIKSMKGNLVPTLQTYMAGKDQYLKFINSMIDDQESKLMSLDMTNPMVAEDYKRQIDYLYTLQGRQNQRYTNFLNSAIADYNADVTNVQSHYDTVYKEYQNAMTTQGTMAQNDYNNLVTRMSAAYTELDNAPIKFQNLRALTLANDAAALQNAQNAGTNGIPTNPKAQADWQALTKDYTDTNATGENQNDLDMTKLDATGLVGIYKLNSYAASDPQAATKMINTTMASSMKNSQSLTVADDFKKLIAQLSSSDIGDKFTPSITPTFNMNAAQYVVKPYVDSNLSTIKSAVDTLIHGGLKDQTAWDNKYKNLDKNVRNGLFNLIKKTYLGDYINDPNRFMKEFFATKSEDIATGITTYW